MSLALIWIIRIIVILFVLRFVVRFFAASRPQQQARGRRTSGTLREGGALVRDPNCGTYVPRTSQFVLGTGDAAVYFCSAACLDAWRAKSRADRAS